MKYRFITILHNMKMEKIKNKGTVIFQGARISNGERIISETIKTDLMKATLGVHSVDEFEDSVYAYIDVELKHINTFEEMDEIGVRYTFSHLRQIQHFIHHMWGIKDNNIYVRDGYILAYKNNFEDGCTYKASLSEVYSRSDLEHKESLFSDEEIASALHGYYPPTVEELQERNTDGGKFGTADHLFAKSGTTRLTRAHFFTSSARRDAIFPTKIVSYCTALECLFNSGPGEITHKISERVALMLGTSKESKEHLYDFTKKAYGYRSSLVHGQLLRGTEENLKDYSVHLDDILRKLLVGEHEIFSKEKEKDGEMDNFFKELLFSSKS